MIHPRQDFDRPARKRGQRSSYLTYREPVVWFVLHLIAIMSKAEGLSPTLPLFKLLLAQ